jgi:excisionase family DNA binding protein
VPRRPGTHKGFHRNLLGRVRMYFVKPTTALNVESRHQSGAVDPALLLTMVEAAELLRISRGKVYHLVWDGRLEPIRIGRRVLFTRASLDRLILELQGR